MARRGSTANAADDVENTETENTETGSAEAQAPEHAESGEGEQAGSATGEYTEQGAEEGKSDQGAVTAEGEGATTTHMESVQRSGDLSDASGEIPPGSTGTRSPDPELLHNLGQNERAVAREAQRAEDLEAGRQQRSSGTDMSDDKEQLEGLNQELLEAERAVADAVAKRDDLRTQHDRLTDRIQAAGNTPFGEITSSYFAASDKQAAEEAEQRKKLSALGLGALLNGRTV